MSKANVAISTNFDQVVSGTKIVGEIISESPIKVDGTIQGNLTCKERVVVGKTGVVVGDIKCKDADISGRVDGKIFASNLLQLRNSANVKGEIKINKLEVEAGAIFDGTCIMSNVGSSTQVTSGLSSMAPKNGKI